MAHLKPDTSFEWRIDAAATDIPRLRTLTIRSSVARRSPMIRTFTVHFAAIAISSGDDRRRL